MANMVRVVMPARVNAFSAKAQMKKRPNRAKLRLGLKIIVFLILLAVFVYQVKDQVAKFLTAATTMSVTSVPHETLSLPALTFCTNPSFKPVPAETEGMFSLLRVFHANTYDSELIFPANLSDGLNTR